MAAALEVLKTFKEKDVIGHGRALVKMAGEGFAAAVEANGVPIKILRVLPWVVVCVFHNSEGVYCPKLRTLFMQEMIGTS